MAKIKSINPFTGELIQEFEPLSASELEAKLVSGSDAFERWKETSFKYRAVLFKKVAEEIRQNREQYARLISTEMGKVIKESRAELDKCALVCDYYAEEAEGFLAEEIIPLPPPQRAKLIHQPLGIILAVMPWNFPFWQVFRFAAPTLMAGNTGMLKHASNVPQCALAIEEIFSKAGFPQGVFQSLLIDSDTTLKLIEDPRIKAVTLTGSEKAGAAVAATAGNHLKKTLLELGGSDPFIVLKDADLPKAAEIAVRSRMINFGQSCIAAKRFIIEEKIYEEFLKLFTENLSKLQLGDSLDENADFACLARPDLAQELYLQVEKSIEAGAKIILGGNRPELGSARFLPTILTDIPPHVPAYSEELFGPVACMYKVSTAEEAVLLANVSFYGLGASIWTSDAILAERLASKIESGAVFINSMVASHPMLPFGGIKKSGYGRELGRNGILEFVNTKTISFG
jgi:succinate-semialdehyde dehydrogenase/glutarate-semialdehyde dehydrogenase